MLSTVHCMLQMRELRDHVVGTMRESRRSGNFSANQNSRRNAAQRRQLHYGHSRLEEEVRGPRAFPVRST